MEEQTKEQLSDKNAWIYAILLWLFGALGIHKFYLNKTGWGILYLLTAGVLGIGVLVDFISLIFVKIQDNSGKMLHGAGSLKTFTAVVLILYLVVIVSIATILIAGL